jgi:putative phage-type endonuclease
MLDDQANIKRVVKENYKPEADQLVRSQGLGGSDASIILGLNPFKNRVELWEEKTGAKVPADLSDIEKIKWGVLLEDIIAKEYADRTGKRVRNVNRTYRHKDFPFLQGHIDKKIEGENAGVEIKNVGLRQAKYWMKQPPIYYEYQVLHYLAITGFDYFDVVALVGGQELMIHTIRRDERIEELVQKEVEFWNEYVLKKVPPMPETPSESASLFPIGEVDKVAYLPVGDDYLIEEYHENVELIKRTEKRNDAIKTSFQNNMKEASVCENSEGERVATWATQTRSSLDQKQMKIDEPDLCAKYLRESSFRRFSVTAKKERNE